MAAYQCGGCNKKFDSVDTCFSSFECRKGHEWHCCKGECHRAFEKRCAKVADAYRKLQQKLNNEGQAPALRRVQANEREKLKAYLEAEKSGSLICPKECTGSQGSIPSCSFVMALTKAPILDDLEDKPQAEAEEGAETPSTEKPLPALADFGDEELIVHKKEDDDLVEDTTVKKSKKADKQKNKKGQKIILDFKSPPINAESDSVRDTPVASAVASNPWGGAGLGAAHAAAQASPALSLSSHPPLGQTQAPLLSQPSASERQQKVKTLTSTTGCSEQKATDLLEVTSWNLNAAAELFFKQEQDSSQPRWGLKVGPTPAPGAAPGAGAAQGRPPKESPPPKEKPPPAAQVIEEEEPLAEPEAAEPEAEAAPMLENPVFPELIGQSQPSKARSPPPLMAPSQPPPPPLPADWVALWCDNHNAYYFWHKPTNRTTWDMPVAEASPDTISPSSPSRPKVVEIPYEKLVADLRDTMRIDETLARTTLESSEWNLDRAILKVREAQEAAKRHAEEEDRRKAAEAAERFARAREREKHRLARLGIQVVMRHWSPKEDIRNCLHVHHGERFEVTWNQENAEGWAYGAAVDDPNKAGYLPQDILRPLGHKPRQRVVGETCMAVETFDPPPEVSGYLQVSIGDALTVKHALDPPYVWAYVGKVRRSAQDLSHDAGWVPECILGDGMSDDALPPARPLPGGRHGMEVRELL
eukprot:TRINITY_DN122050_c0_g1_i1.p1 TRINITY_DN122050_c0_g1~~TRINITY_DN122050_c0_g1_i1.p1  ORF type:complete len:700 (+),score=179.57 TRINITY_DN122050_c0_g1_i1:114-2213(+)